MFEWCIYHAVNRRGSKGVDKMNSKLEDEYQNEKRRHVGQLFWSLCADTDGIRNERKQF